VPPHLATVMQPIAVRQGGGARLDLQKDAATAMAYTQAQAQAQDEEEGDEEKEIKVRAAGASMPILVKIPWKLIRRKFWSVCI